jgi:hypothetical protein
MILEQRSVRQHALVCDRWMGGRLVFGWEVAWQRTILLESEQIRPLTSPVEPLMPATGTKKSSPPEPSREERIEAIMQQLRPKIEQVVRQMVEHAVDVPEDQEFGAIDTQFRDAGQKLATDVRQASLASRQKRGTSGAA